MTIRKLLTAVAAFVFVLPVEAQNTLDQLGLSSSTPAVGAYSIRKLSSSYAGSALRIRRSSDNAEQDIAFLASGDLDTSALKSFVGSGSGFVRTWYDQSGVNNHIQQASQANQPMLVNNGTIIRQNNRPVIEFSNAAVTFLSTTTATGVAGNAASSMFMATRFTNGGSSADMPFVLGQPGSNTRIRALYRIGNGVNAGYVTWGNDVQNSTLSLDIRGEMHSFGVVQSGQNLDFFRDANSVTQTLPSAVGTIQSNVISVGTLQNNTTGFATDMVTGEAVAFVSALGSADRQALQCSQQSYFSVQNPLQANAYIVSTPVGISCQYAEEAVAWKTSDLVNTTAQGNNLVRVAGSSNWDGGASSWNSVSNNGYLQFVASETNTARMLGLSSSNVDANFNTIQYAIYLLSNGQIQVYESGSNRGGFGNYQTGDVFRIQVENGQVKYYQNGVNFYNSPTLPTLPLVADASINTTNGTLSQVVIGNLSGGQYTATLQGAVANSYQWFLNGNPVGSNSSNYTNPSLLPNDVVSCQIQYNGGCASLSVAGSNSSRVVAAPVFSNNDFHITGIASAASCAIVEEDVIWDKTSFVNVRTSGNNLEKMLSGGWDGGAVSLNKVYNEGFMTFTAAETNRSRMIGLSNVNGNASYTTIQYAFFLRNDGVVEIYEGGNGRGNFGTYVSGDVFKIAVEGNVVKYYRNGVQIYISNQTPTLPLMVDISIAHVGGTASNVKISNYSEGQFVAFANPLLTAASYQWNVNGNNVGTNAPSYQYGALNNNDVIVCRITPNIDGCAFITYTSNTLVNKQVTPVGINFSISAVAANASCVVAEEEVNWDRESLRNVTANGSNLIKIQSNGAWTGGAFSLNRVYAEGYLTFIASETNRARMVGLSNVNTDSSFQNIRYAVFLRSDGNYEIYESGVSRASLGAYASNDVFKIAVEGNAVKYYRNNILVYISGFAPTLPLMVDVSINTQGGTVTSPKVVNYSQGDFVATVSSSVTNPSFQWYVNGNPVGANSATYSNGSLTNNDVVTCVLTPYINGCQSVTYTSNQISIRQDQPIGIDFGIAGDPAQFGCAQVEEEVSWLQSSLRNVEANGNDLRKLQQNGTWTGGAVSVNKVYAEGSLSFTATETNTYRMVGLSQADVDSGFIYIQYGFYLRNDATYEIRETGAFRGNFGTYSANDVFKIAVESGVVRYYRNGNLVYISTLTPTLPLIADVSIYNTNGTVTNAKITNYNQGVFTAFVGSQVTNPSYQWYLNGNPVGTNSATYSNGSLAANDVVSCVLTPNLNGCSATQYTSNLVYIRHQEPAGIDFLITAANAVAGCAVAEEQVAWEKLSLTGVDAQGNSLNKIQNNGPWDGGAASLNKVFDEGYFVFTAIETNRSRMAGLSSSNTNSNFNTIQYAVYLRNDGLYEIYESGNSRGNFGAYAANDVFKIAVEGGRVKYYRNNVLVYNSTIAPTLPLLVDVSISHVGGTINNARIFNYSQGVYTATVSSNVSSPSFQWLLNGNPVGTNSSIYTNANLAADDVLTCVLTPNINGCSLINYTSNSITNRQVTPVGINFTITATAASTGCAVAEEQVSWDLTSLNNVTAISGNLNKMQNNGSFDGGAASINRVYNEGFFSFTAVENNRARVVGLSNTNVNNAGNTIQYAFYLRNDGSYEIWESGSGRGNFGAYAANDIFKISVEAGVVKYYRGNTLVYISTISPTLPLLVDVSLVNTNATVVNPTITNFSQGTYTALVSSNVTNPVYQWMLNGAPVGTNSPTYSNGALNNGDIVTCVLTPNLGGCNLVTYNSNTIVNRTVPVSQTIDFYITSGSTSTACKEAIEDVVWRKSDLVNTSSNNNNLLKVQSGGNWNGGAASMNTVDNNGYFQFTATENNTSRMAGLSNVNANSNFNTIQYAIYLRNDGLWEVYESGNGRGNFGSYNAGDVFRVSIDNGVVRYSRNGAIVYSSNITPSFPLIADVSINSINGTVSNAKIANNSNTGLFTATVVNAGVNPVIVWKVNGSVVQTGTGTTYINTGLNTGDVVTAELNPTLNGCSSASYASNAVLINGPGAVTTWTGTSGTDWFNASNWTAGVPNRFTSAVIPFGAANNPTITANANVYNLTINASAALTISGTNQLFVYSTFTNNGTFTANQSRVTFTTCGNNGFAVAGSGTTTFYNLTINNPGGVTMSNGTFQVSNNMTFTNGIVQQNGTLVILNGATVTGASNQSHVNGIVHKTGNQAFTFPVGKGGVYRPITMSAPSVATAQFAAEYFNAPQNLGFTYQAPINHVSGCEYWSLNRTIGSSNVSVTLNWNQALCPMYTIPMVPNLRVAHWTGTVWADRGATGITGNSASGTVTSSPAVSQFGFFTLGTNTALNVLPMQLTSFTAELQGNLVDVKWETSSEQNCDFYTVERSTDNMNFESIGTVKGHGTTNLVSKYGLQDRNINGLSRAYYRLKQTDLDGRTQYSKTILVKFEATTSGFSVYPSPNNGVFNLKGNLQKVKQMQLLNLSGVVVRRLPLQTQHSLSDLKPGMYILQIIGDGFTEHVRFVKY